MGSIIGWVSALCFAAVACTVMRMIAPEGSLGKVFKIITVAFFLCAFFTPLLSAKNLLSLKSVNLNLNREKISATLLQEEVDMQFNTQINNTITTVCHEVLSEMDVNILKVETKLNFDKKGSVQINNITVYLDKDSQVKTLEVGKRLEDAFGVNVIVRTEIFKS